MMKYDANTYFTLKSLVFGLQEHWIVRIIDSKMDTMKEFSKY